MSKKGSNTGGNSPEARRQRVQYMARVGGKFARGKVAVQAKSYKSTDTRRVKPTPITQVIAKPSKRDRSKSQRPMENFIAIVVDASGSMAPHTRAAAAVVNAQLETIRKQMASSGQTAIVAIIAFDEKVRLLYQGSPINYVFTWPGGFNGMTALLDATKHAIREFEVHEKDNYVDRTFLVYVVTDGGENSSKYVTREELGQLVKTKVASDRWTFGFAVPPGHTGTIAALGIVTENIIEWETTKEGFRHLEQKLDLGYVNYTMARSSGLKSANTASVNLFAVDLGSGLQIKNTRGNWDNTSSIFSSHKVEKETDIKSFIETKRGSFAEGIGFYELTKKELVHGHKDIVLLDKSDPTKCLRGNDAKLAIGMPTGQDLKVDPFNVSKYKIFVQSTSNNRKLVRGTEVLVRK